MTSSRPALWEGLIWFLLIVLCFAPSHVSSNNAHSIVKRSTNGTTFFDYCQPWICSCYYNGIYYEPNQRWTSKTQNCTEFVCEENGFFRKDKIGVWHSGECRYVNDTWTDNMCFKYKVVDKGEDAAYELVSGGCATQENDNCIAVGERIERSCNTYECQIVGTCYQLVAVQYGCTHGLTTSGAISECKPLHSIWNDACVVFQCLPDAATTTNTKIRIHSHTNMLWPRGNYALVKPETGCPAHVEEAWDEGERVHYSEAPNFYSNVFRMDGNHTDRFMEHRFCTHEDYLRPGYIPLYHTSWDAGRYCILKYNGSCPRNFTEGYVKMIDFVGNITLDGETVYVNGSVNGTLPDGAFWENSTLLEFCCRGDGDLNTELILPANRPFVLFMGENETECQEVRAMTVEKEFFSFGDVDEGFERELNGSLPRILVSDNNTMIHLCHYRPMDCGCYYETGEYVALNDLFTTKDNCVVYRCVRQEILNINALQLVTGQCSFNGNCYPVGTTLSEPPRGEGCYNKVCRQKFNTAKEYFQAYYEFEVVPSGCRMDDVCEPLGTVKDMGCYESTCHVDVTTGEPRYVVTKEGCDFGGSCVPLGHNVTDNECVTLQCQLAPTRDKTEMVVTQGGCKTQTTCHPVNGVWRDDCVDYTCKEFNNGTAIEFYADPIQLYCADQNGTCHKMGDLVDSTCWTYQCAVNAKTGHRGLTVVNGGCRHKGVCRAKDEIWNSGCSNFTCSVLNNSTHFRWSIEYVNPGCDVGNGSCIPVGANITIGCATYQCRKGAGECGLVQTSGACRAFDGTCVAQNETWKSECTTYQCNVYTDKVVFEPVTGGCMWNHVCHDEGQQWNDTCKTYECEKVDYGYKTKLIAKGCQDGKGGCMQAGEVIETNCNKMKCFTTEYECRIDIIEAGCSYNDQCYRQNETFPSKHSKCRTLRCDVERNQTRFTMRIATVNDNCQYNGNCFNDTMTLHHQSRCYLLTCDSSFKVEIDYSSTMCRSTNGTCIAQNSTTKFETSLVYQGQNYLGTNCSCGAQGQASCNYQMV